MRRPPDVKSHGFDYPCTNKNKKTIYYQQKKTMKTANEVRRV